MIAPPDPDRRPDLFTVTVDGIPAQLVRPSDTSAPTWYAYDDGAPLGALYATREEGGAWMWRAQIDAAAHADLADAVRALRGPRKGTSR